MTGPSPLVIRGWTIYAHPLFLAQVETLAQEVEALNRRDPIGFVHKNASKRLAAITKLAFDVIPQDPARPEYRQGNALGPGHKHWFRAKFLAEKQRSAAIAARPGCFSCPPEGPGPGGLPAGGVITPSEGKLQGIPKARRVI